MYNNETEMNKVKERELKDTYSSLASRVILAGAADVFYEKDVDFLQA